MESTSSPAIKETRISPLNAAAPLPIHLETISQPDSAFDDEGIFEPEDPHEYNLPVPLTAVTHTIRPLAFQAKQFQSDSSSSNASSAEEHENEFQDEKLRIIRKPSKNSFIVDEFGFKLDLSKSVLPPPFTESVENRRNWLACLEFTYTHSMGVPQEDSTHEESLWSRLLPRLSTSTRLTELIRGSNPSVVPKYSGVPSSSETHIQKDACEGIPHSLRGKIWPRLAGAFDKQQKAATQSSPLTYADLVHCSQSIDPYILRQIEKDLLRTMPQNVCFSSASSIGVPRLRRVLIAIAWLYTDVGYCQGLGVIAANLLLLMEEEAAFWMLCSVIEDILPPSYFSADSLLGVQADQRVLCELISMFLPRVADVLKRHDVELALITLGWFLTLFSGVLSMRVMLRVWDLLFYEGSTVLFRIALAILKLKEEELVSTTNTASFFNAISNAPGSITNVAELINVAYSFEDEYLDVTYIDGLRRHHLSQLLIELNTTYKHTDGKPLPKQFLSKRMIERKPSIFCGIFGNSQPQETDLFPGMAETPGSLWLSDVVGSALCVRGDVRARLAHFTQIQDLDAADPKIKNIRQTELLVNLRKAIMEIVRHFHNNDPSHATISAQADYSLASHGKDLTAYVQTASVQTRRAKALEDFARQENDELGFRRNDIINVLDMHDDHCWLGEMETSEGLRGWFPAKLVELLDERSKRYSPAGDDTVYPSIGLLVRSGLCSKLCSIFLYGLKRFHGLSDGSTHPWKFIKEVASREAERDSSSIHSRLVLCRTFRLDEVGKVLSPEELLYRSIHTINASHNTPDVNDDMKFRTLICIGLNELVLHLWLEILCSCEEVVTKWYHPWSFLRSPGWVQIKCELRVLSQFAFHLYPLWEVNGSLQSSGAMIRYEPQIRSTFQKAKLPLRLLSKLHLGVRPVDPADCYDFGAFLRDTESVGDMLIKYHLFSWEL